MPEKPFELLLHRELHIHDVNTHFTPQLELLRDVVNYGTNLIPSCLASSSRGLGEVMVITVLFKQIVQMLDGFEVLVSAAAIPAAALQTRAMLEASFYVEWILKGDIEKKALYYHVSDIRKERKWFRRMAAGTEEHKDFEATLGEFAQTMKASTEKIAGVSLERLREIDAFLANEPYATISAEFDAEKKRGKGYEPEWYRPLGQFSVRSIAKELGRLPDYEVFYGQFSETMHASRHGKHITIAKGKITLEPIRHIEQCRFIMCYTLCLALRAYRMILNAYRPGQIAEFERRYITEWQSAFMNVKEVRYKASEIVTI